MATTGITAAGTITSASVGAGITGSDWAAIKDALSEVSGADVVRATETKELSGDAVATDPTIAPTYAQAQAGTHVFMRGHQGEGVKTLQENLIRLGYLDPAADANQAADGIFGPATEAAVRAFQKDHGVTIDGETSPLAVDGKAGINTLTAIDEQLAALGETTEPTKTEEPKAAEPPEATEPTVRVDPALIDPENPGTPEEVYQALAEVAAAQDGGASRAALLAQMGGPDGFRDRMQALNEVWKGRGQLRHFNHHVYAQDFMRTFLGTPKDGPGAADVDLAQQQARTLREEATLYLMDPRDATRARKGAITEILAGADEAQLAAIRELDPALAQDLYLAFKTYDPYYARMVGSALLGQDALGAFGEGGRAPTPEQMQFGRK